MPLSIWVRATESLARPSDFLRDALGLRALIAHEFFYPWNALTLRFSVALSWLPVNPVEKFRLDKDLYDEAIHPYLSQCEGCRWACCARSGRSAFRRRATMGVREIEVVGGSWQLHRLDAFGAHLLVTLPLRVSAASATGV